RVRVRPARDRRHDGVLLAARRCARSAAGDDADDRRRARVLPGDRLLHVGTLSDGTTQPGDIVGVGRTGARCFVESGAGRRVPTPDAQSVADGHAPRGWTARRNDHRGGVLPGHARTRTRRDQWRYGTSTAFPVIFRFSRSASTFETSSSGYADGSTGWY